MQRRGVESLVEVIEADERMTKREKTSCELRADKPSAASKQDTHRRYWLRYAFRFCNSGLVEAAV